MNQTTRIVVMANNQVGVIADITTLLADAGINLESINTEVNNEQGTVILTTDNSDHTLYVLKAGYKAVGRLPAPRDERWATRCWLSSCATPWPGWRKA